METKDMTEEKSQSAVADIEETKEETTEAPAVEEESIDFKALYDEEVVKLGKAEKAIERIKGKEKKSDEDDIEAKLENVVKKVMTTSQVDTLISQSSSNEDEAKLIRFHYENSIQKTGFSPEQIREDIENSKLIANKKKIYKTTEEMKVALNNKKSISNISGGSDDKPDIEVKEHWAQDDKFIEYIAKREQELNLPKGTLKPSEYYKNWKK